MRHFSDHSSAGLVEYTYEVCKKSKKKADNAYPQMCHDVAMHDGHVRHPPTLYIYINVYIFGLCKKMPTELTVYFTMRAILGAANGISIDRRAHAHNVFL